jgi:hypothetical protein
MTILAGWAGLSVGFLLGALWGWAVRRNRPRAERHPTIARGAWTPARPRLVVVR